MSIDRVERPRRSMFGLNVDVEPVTDVSWFVVEPVIEEFCEVEEPVTDGLAVALPAALTPVVAVPVTAGEFVVPAALVPAGLVPLVAEACESGMQSMWTGLEERSLALPVSLPASLPALGWSRSLHSGLLVDAVGALVAVLALSVNWAQAGAVPSRAARVMVLR